MDVILVPIQWMLRRFKVRSPSHKGFRGSSPLGSALDFIHRLTLRYYYEKAKNDYRRSAHHARRLGSEWNHNEALLVEMVEHYLKECEHC
ncbi:MAG: hypothetical protein GX349_04680 [Firmicutes bacterium]|nr:hypothetical protein [Bacillota bacterium]